MALSPQRRSGRREVDGVWIRLPGSARPPVGSMRHDVPGVQALSCDVDQAGKPAGHRGLGRARVGPLAELARGERGVSGAEGGCLAQRRGERVEEPLLAQLLDRLDLGVRGEALADEVRVVGVRDAVRLCAQPCHERALLERDDGVGGAGNREVRLDRVPALGVRRGVLRAVDHAEPDVGGRRDAAQEGRARVRRECGPRGAGHGDR